VLSRGLPKLKLDRSCKRNGPFPDGFTGRQRHRLQKLLNFKFLSKVLKLDFRVQEALSQFALCGFHFACAALRSIGIWPPEIIAGSASSFANPASPGRPMEARRLTAILPQNKLQHKVQQFSFACR
jgi:hypothetical protein